MSISTLTVRVAGKAREALDICTFELVAVNGTLPAFSAGAHIDVRVPNSATRQYSLCNSSSESHRYVIGVLRDPSSRGGSIAMHDQVKEGDLLEISAPKNHFSLAKDASRSILLAGGIGVTPILCMAERLATTGADFEMHYCTRASERTAFRERIKESSFSRKVTFHFDDGPEDQRLDAWALLSKQERGAHLYVCGPKGFMDAMLGTARAQGWPEEQLHYEFFSNAGLRSGSDGSFEIQLASSGRVITVEKEKSVVQALADAGIKVATSCEQGVCGTCLTRVLEGIPEHKDLFLTPEEQARNDQFLPCCSRAVSPHLVLDL